MRLGCPAGKTRGSGADFGQYRVVVSGLSAEKDVTVPERSTFRSGTPAQTRTGDVVRTERRIGHESFRLARHRPPEPTQVKGRRSGNLDQCFWVKADTFPTCGQCAFAGTPWIYLFVKLGWCATIPPMTASNIQPGVAAGFDRRPKVAAMGGPA